MTIAALNVKVTKIGNKILHVTHLTKKAFLDTKATEVESKIGGITNLATRATLTAKATQIENRMPDTSGFITTPVFNKLKKKLLKQRKTLPVKIK